MFHLIIEPERESGQQWCILIYKIKCISVEETHERNLLSVVAVPVDVAAADELIEMDTQKKGKFWFFQSQTRKSSSTKVPESFQRRRRFTISSSSSPSFSSDPLWI